MRNLLATLSGLVLALSLTLPTNAAPQGPVPVVPANPWATAPPNPPTPGCSLGTTVAPGCLIDALAVYTSKAQAAQDKASAAYLKAKFTYNTAVNSAADTYRSCVHTTANQPACAGAHDIAIAQAIGAFNSDVLFAENVWFASMDAASAAFKGVVNGCCVDLAPLSAPGGIPQLPSLPGCGLTPPMEILCPEGPADPACNAACNAWRDSERGIKCSEAQSSLDQAYSLLVSSLDIALSKLTAAMGQCPDEPCGQLALDAYNDTYNTVWQEFFDVYTSISATLSSQLSAIDSETGNCLARCCP